MNGAAVVFKLGAAIDGYIDNIKLTTGWEQSTCDGHYVNGEWNVETASTCKTNGMSYAVCSACNAKIYRELPVSDTHNMVDGKCVDCGSTYSYDLEFTNKGTYYAVTGIGTCTAKEIYIPAQIDGIPVQSIAVKAFYDNATITKIVMPDSITILESNAIWNCSALETVILSGALQTPSTNTIGNCAKLQYTIESDGCMYLGSATNDHFMLMDVQTTNVTAVSIHPKTQMINGNAFNGCSALTSIEIPSSVRYIGFFAFRNCDSLTEMIIPEGVKRIENFVFADCDSLKKVSLPASVTYMGHDFFSGCPVVESVSVHADNQNYFCAGNCIIQKSNGTLKSGCVSSVIPNDGSVKAFNIYAFQDVPIVSVKIPDGVSVIANGVFRNNKALKEVYIPSSVTKISDKVFDGCTALTTVRYGGTEEQWAKIKIGSNNSWLTDANIVYNYTPATHSIGLEYELSADGSYYTVTGIGTCTDNTLVIPGKYNGIAVTTIGEDAFINATQITSVIILEGVKIIGADAFRYCNSLKTITLPDSLVEIKSRAFDSCVSLECLEIPVGVTNISNSFGIIAGCISLTTLTVNPLNTTFHSENNCVIKTQTKELWMGCSTSVIPSDGSVETLGRYAFSGMNLQNVVIPDTITTILGYAFQNCDLITSMTIPANVSSITSTPFNRCDNLTSLTVDPANKTYYSVDNCIIEKGTQKLMCVASEFVLPEDGTITTMMGWTFDNQQFTELVIPDGMAMIGQRAFQNCDKLVEITIPDTVISIESGAFTFCDSLSLVRFTGSEEQWNKIVIAEYNDCLLDATIVFGK